MNLVSVPKGLWPVLALGLLILGCSKSEDVAGGVSGSGNALVTGRVQNQDGSPAPQAQVMLLPADHNPVLREPDASRIDTTDSQGLYSIATRGGVYNLQSRSLKNGTLALVRGVVVVERDDEITVDAPPATLLPPGSVRVALDHLNAASDGYLYIPGTSLKTGLDSASIASGRTSFSSVPSGDLPGVLYLRLRDTATAIPLTQNLQVVAGQSSAVAKAKPVSICYSAGLRASALFSGTGSAVRGLLTLDTPAPDFAGVGDEVRMASGSCTISRRHSPVSFNIITSRGMDTASFPSTGISIHRSFNSLAAALDASSGGSNASDSLHLNTADLLAGNISLSIACYADGEDTRPVLVRGWRTSPINFIRIFTPVSDTEAGASQRHHGRWDPLAYALHRTSDNSFQAALACHIPHLRMEGLQIGLTSGNSSTDGIFYYEQGSGEFDVSHCIVRGVYSGERAFGRGIYVYNNSGNGPFIRFWNNIIYGFPDSIDAGIQIHFPNTAGVIANNTFINCYLGISGFVDRVVLKNNLAQGCRRGYFPWNQLNPENDYNLSNSIEWNLDALHSRDTARVLFVDSANGDFHLSPADTSARDKGFPAPVPGVTQDDIDGQSRIAPWDIGADEAQ